MVEQNAIAELNDFHKYDKAYREVNPEAVHPHHGAFVRFAQLAPSLSTMDVFVSCLKALYMLIFFFMFFFLFFF